MVGRRRSWAGHARERAPRLVLRFAVFTALGLGLAAAAIVLVVRKESTARAQRQAIEQARFATEAVLKPELRPGDLRSRPTASRQRDLDRLFRSRVLLEGLRDVTLYGPDGRATYSTGPQAAAPLPERRLHKALEGTSVSDVAVSGDGAKVLRTYAPVVLGPPRTLGIAGFEHDYARIEAASRRSSWVIAGVLEGLLLVLFLLLAPALGHVTFRVRQHVAELERVAVHDDVTGLPNRLGFRRAAESVLANEESSGALVVIDLDGFSEINDVLGCDSGDALLSWVGKRLLHELPDCMTVARLGEDEFGLVLESGGRAEIAAVAARVERSLAEPFLVDGVRLAVFVSIGAALFGEHGSDLAAVLRRAGAALSVAKEAGQSNIQIYGPEHEANHVVNVTIAAELRDALDGGELLVHYQPQADLTTKAVRGVEALVRWQHPRRGLLTADKFIAQAERSALATEVRGFVLETSARQWREWRELGIDLELAVNLSTVDMLDVSLPDQVASLLDRYEIPAWNLVLEITERTLVADDQRIGRVVDRLGQIGVRLAIDDFGTGQSSIASLRQFPIQQIKLDRELLARAPTDPAARVILRSCAEIAHAIDAIVVAEGVETHEHWRLASDFGCDIAQGYLIGRPVAGHRVPDLLQAIPLVTGLAAA